MKIRDIMLLALLFGAALSRNSHADICYVDAGATGTRTGTSWVNAYQNLEFALLQPTCSEFWIAKGVYKPTFGTNPSASFVINRDVKLYGGFASGETSLDQRNPEVNLTVLSGDIDNNDTVTDPRYATSEDIVGQNSYHVFTLDGTAVPITSQTVLDGLIITGGQADLSSDDGSGGGLDCVNDCSPTIRNTVFSGNTALFGGGMYLAYMYSDTAPTLALENDFFFGNFGGFQGGAMMIIGFSSVTLTNLSFENNLGGSGGALYTESDGSIVNGVFIDNLGLQEGAAIYTTANLSIVNSTLVKNGDAPEATQDVPTIRVGNNKVRLVNDIVWENRSGIFGYELGDRRPSISVSQSVLDQPCPLAISCDHVSSDDPLIRSTRLFGGHSLLVLPQPSGSAVDHGSDAYCPSFDTRYVARPQGAHCDIGAVEWRLSDDTIFADGFQVR